MISKWNYLPLTTEEQISETELLTRFVSCPRPVGELLARRGVTTAEGAQRFFHPSLKDMHDPFLMPGMDKAVERLNRAMGSKEKILVYGDYDVDGTTAVALVYKYLQNFYSEIEYYIPTRYDDGYGISRHNIDQAAAMGVKLIVILDCGIKANDEISYARSLGIDFIICDHHMPDDELPDAAAILNPKLPGSTYPCRELSGCGVGYKLMQGFALSNGLSTVPLENMLDLVALSVAADLVPMVDENRIMTYYGLRRINTNPNMGLRAIIRACGLSGKEITLGDLSFKIGPRINASGRMQSGRDAVDLMVSRDMKDAHARAAAIDQYNRDRKELDQRITQEARQLLADRATEFDRGKSVVIYNPQWHKGIIGIVAARMAEQCYKPSVILTHSGQDGYVTGSSRSVQGFDIYSAVKSARHLLENFGGHTYAVGMTLKEENVPEFTRLFEEYVASHILPSQTSPRLNIDAYISLGDITPELVNTLRLFNPYGPGNQKPLFCTLGVQDFGDAKLVGRALEHIKLDLTDSTTGKVYPAIAFGAARYFDHIHAHKPFDIVYTIEENKHHNAPPTLQLLIKGIRPHL